MEEEFNSLGHTERFAVASQKMKILGQKHGFKYLDGADVACPWLVNEDKQSVVAYHGFDGVRSFVAWDHCGPVYLIEEDEIIPFLQGDVNLRDGKHEMQKH
jgi:hypothetical protein